MSIRVFIKLMIHGSSIAFPPKPYSYFFMYACIVYIILTIILLVAISSYFMLLVFERSTIRVWMINLKMGASDMFVCILNICHTSHLLCEIHASFFFLPMNRFLYYVFFLFFIFLRIGLYIINSITAN